MKKYIIGCMAMAFSIGAMGQVSTFSKSDLVFNATIGFGSTLYSGGYYSSSVPALAISGEYGVVNDLFDVDGLNLGVGGIVGFASSKWESRYLGERYGWKYSYFLIGARGAVHYTFTDKLDTYAGLMLGFNIVSSKETGNHEFSSNYSAASSSVFPGGYIGVRYYLSNNFAVMSELGYSIAYFNIGVSLKM